MLSKAVLLIQASPFVFLVIALCGCGGSETLPADGGQASPEPAGKAPVAARKEAAGAPPTGEAAAVQERRLGGIAAIVGDKVISRARLRKKVDRQIRAIMAQRQVAAAAINRRREELRILDEMINKELILQAQLVVYPGRELEDLVLMNNVMAFVDREIDRLRKAGEKQIATRQQFFEAQEAQLGIGRDEAVREIREKMFSEMYLWEEVYSKLDRFVAPAQLRAFFKNNPDAFATPQEVSYQRIKIFDDANCLGKIKGVQAGLQAGTPFGELARAFSDEFQGNPKLRATLFNNKFAELEDFPFPIPVILKRLREGEHSGPDRAQGAFWFFKMGKIIKGEPKTFKEVQVGIENKLLTERRRLAYNQLIERLRADTRVEVFNGPATAAPPTAASPPGGGLSGQRVPK